MAGLVISTLRKIGNFWYGGIKENICFLHVPKCGGQSLNDAIKKYYFFSNASITSSSSFEAATLLYRLKDPVVKEFDDVLKFREYILLYFMSDKEIRYISGHFCFSDIAYRNFHEKYKFITLLRDPVKRWLSNYFFHRYKTHSDYIKVEDDITTFLQSERSRSEGHRYVKMIGGVNDSGDYASQQAIDRAKANLHKFELVGCLEYVDDFLNQFEDRFGVVLHLPKKNQNPKSREFIRSIVTEEIEAQIACICQPDFEIYNYAVETFVKKGNHDLYV